MNVTNEQVNATNEQGTGNMEKIPFLYQGAFSTGNLTFARFAQGATARANVLLAAEYELYLRFTEKHDIDPLEYDDWVMNFSQHNRGLHEKSW